VFIFVDRFSENDIIANAMIMFIGGSDPVSTTLAFCLHELAINTHIQDKLRQHILATKEIHDGKFNNDYLINLNYVDMVIAGITFIRKNKNIVCTRFYYL